MTAAADLRLDLDVFEGPFDLLLALVLREELALAEVELAQVVAAFVEHLAECEHQDPGAVAEFVVLVAALLEIKARHLFPEDDVPPQLTSDEAEDELLDRLADLGRYRGAAGWLADRLAGGRRVFREGPPPLAPRPRPVVPFGAADPARLAAALDGLLVPPPAIDVSQVGRRLVPMRHFLDRFRRLLSERSGFAFEEAVAGLDRLAQATAFLAMLELVKRGDAAAEQAEPFGPIRVARRGAVAPPAERADDARAIA
jgi:segregation and condensation protein A